MGIIDNIQKERDKIRNKMVEDALKDAKKVAKILVEKFGAKEVVLYGSLLEKRYYDDTSDIDLAVKGLGNKYFRAYGYCIGVSKFNLDIRAYEDMTKKFRDIVNKEGKKLYEKKS